MTICVATIAHNGVILGAADRLLSTDSMKYEPRWSKIWMLPNRSVVIMWAGHSALQAEVIQDFSVRAGATEGNYPLLADVARVYGESYHRAVDSRAESKILRRNGVTLADFNAGRHNLAPATVELLERRLAKFVLPESMTIGAIICGVDRLGPHIWTAINDELSCADLEAFAVIGGAEFLDRARGGEWALEILLDEGYRYDSNLFAVRRKGSEFVGGERDAHRLQLDSGILDEAPPPSCDHTHREGGPAGRWWPAYFRHLPYTFARTALKGAERRGVAGTFYINPWELDPGQLRNASLAARRDLIDSRSLGGASSTVARRTEQADQTSSK